MQVRPTGARFAQGFWRVEDAVCVLPGQRHQRPRDAPLLVALRPRLYWLGVCS